MTLEIAFVLGVLLVAVVLFVTEWIRMDLVALLVLSALAVTGIVSPEQAFDGFANPAVVTVWAMFILSAGLQETGVADRIGQRVLGLVGTSEVRMIVVLMLTGAVLSAFMNNIGVAALMLPVTMDIARRTGTPPSRLLMPLAYATLLGGLTTLVGTPPNLLVAEALKQRGLEPFALFDYTPVGGLAMLGGILFVALIGRRLLPRRDPATEPAKGTRDLRAQYSLQERTFALAVPEGSPLVGQPLANSRLGSALGMNVLGVFREDAAHFVPDPAERLQTCDRLLVQGRLDRLEELRTWAALEIDERPIAPRHLESDDVRLAEVRVAAESPLAGRLTHQTGLRRQYGLNVLAILRSTEMLRSTPAGTHLAAGDRLLVQGRRDTLEALETGDEFDAVRIIHADELEAVFRVDYGLDDRLFAVRVPEGSSLEGRSLVESRLGDALGLNVLAVVRGDETQLMPSPDETLHVEDRLVVEGLKRDLDVLRGLQGLEIATATKEELAALESERVGILEAMLAPGSALAGRTLQELKFRDRYGCQVLAIWRQGEVHRSDLRSMSLEFGDALLLQGPRERLSLLAADPEFLVLSYAARKEPRTNRVWVATAILAAVVLPVLLGFVPIAIAAVAGAALMVLTGCLTMDEAHRAIDWRSIFLIAGMLPLGVALEQSGAASLLAEHVVAAVGPFGPWAVIFSFYLITTLATAIIPTAALVVLMAPIVLRASAELGFSPYTAMMAVAMAASASFTSPISHPANVLVMGPGGYRFVDYIRLGLPLSLVVMAITFVVLPIFWPLAG